MSVRVFTVDELLRYDGRDGRSAYVGFAGHVYDVSGSYHWRGGRHHVVHFAGRDITRELEQAPHGVEMLGRVPVIGDLVEREP